MADFKKQGGSLSGREERYDGFEGEPRAVGSALGGSSTTGLGSSGTSGLGSSSTSGTTGLTGSTGHHGQHGTSGSTTANLENKLDPRVDSTGYGNRSTAGSTGTGSSYNDSTTGASTHKKPGLLDRLNPMKDTDGDGKKGFME